MVDVVDGVLRSMSIFFYVYQRTFCIGYRDHINQQIEKKLVNNFWERVNKFHEFDDNDMILRQKRDMRSFRHNLNKSEFIYSISCVPHQPSSKMLFISMQQSINIHLKHL